jgi:hypothetical protein
MAKSYTPDDGRVRPKYIVIKHVKKKISVKFKTMVTPIHKR